eukprot:TCALIF_09912-PB protein Name:"Protein of unknown function" AED:0.40 eAED:0.41 QI:0/0.5/0/1/0/0.33/3/0/547
MYIQPPTSQIHPKILVTNKNSLLNCEQSNADPTLVICTCTHSQQFVNLKPNNYNEVVIGSVYARNLTKKLSFVQCSLKIHPLFFKNLKLEWTLLEISGSYSLQLMENSLSFSHQTKPIEIRLLIIGEPMRLTANIFGGNIWNIKFIHCRLEEFSSEVFKSPLMSPDLRVLIRNSTIHSHFYSQNDTNSALSLVELKALVLINVTVSSSGARFLNLHLEKMFVLHSKLVVDQDRAIMVFGANQIRFEETIIDMRRGAFHLEVDSLELDRVVFQYPTETFKFARGRNGNSTLTLKDIYLFKPSLGALTNTFKTVNVKNVTTSECECSLLDLIVREKSLFMTRIYSEPVDTDMMKAKLRNETYCGDSQKQEPQLLEKYCDLNASPRYGWVIALLVMGFVLALLIITCLFYQWHRKIINQYRVLRYMSFVPRSAEHVTTVRFNDSLQIIPRPPSVFYIDANYQGSLMGSEPDLVRGVRDSIRNSLRSNADVEPKKRSKVSEELDRLEKTSLAIIKELDDDVADAAMVEIDLRDNDIEMTPTGSVVVRDEYD